ncbi:MAG: hypothetical protein ACRD08_03275 [Acidimicrobiales bacterium]
MPNGKPGDHPITDTLIHNLAVYSPTADGLIREIVGLGGRREIDHLLLQRYDKIMNPDVAELERVLTGIRDRLRGDAKERGWEPR